ncbi:MAG: O-antigen ligase family protein [Candidatus Pacebacteria bacterium]|nr:O-antigen ligase family protein [Candidatus Paceibacterota bacterium]
MKVENILRKVVLAGIFLIPFIPFIVSSSLFFPFITGKNFAFRIIVEIIFGGWLGLMLYNPAYRPRFSWLLAAIASFVGIIALADIFGENPLKSIWSNFERMEGLVTLVHLFMYFLVVGTVLNTEKLWTRFLNTSVAVSGLLGIYGLFQLWGFITINQGGVRLDATFGNATYLAIYMLFHVFITALLLMRFKGDRIVRHLYIGIMALQVMMIYFTATRGAILGLLGGVIFAGLLVAIFEREQKTLRKTAIGAVVAVLLVVGGFFAIKNTEFAKGSPVLGRFTNLSLSSGTVDARFQIWGLAIEGVKERPLLGWGQENFNFVFNKYYKPELYKQEQWFDRTHNIVFDWLIAGGILGFLAYLAIALATLFYLWRPRNTFLSIPEKSVITGLLAGYGFHNLFVFDNIISYILYFTVMAFVCFSYRESIKPEVGEVETKTLGTDITSRVYVPIIVVITIMALYLVNGKPILTAHALLRAIATQPGSAEQIESFKKAFSYDTFGNQEAAEQLAQISTRIAANRFDIEVKQQYLSLTETEMQKVVDRVPNDARTQLFFGTVFDSFSQYAKAQPHLVRANELSPKKPTILYQLGFNAFNRGDTAGGLGIFKEAYELAPESKDGAIYYAVGAVNSGDRALLEDILIPTFGSIIVDSDHLVQAYFNNGMLHEVLAVWRLRVEEDPNNPQKRLGLAAAYLELGQRQNTIAELEKMIELDPNYKAQGEYLIREIRAGRNP